jgi:hypothetical protein
VVVVLAIGRRCAPVFKGVMMIPRQRTMLAAAMVQPIEEEPEGAPQGGGDVMMLRATVPDVVPVPELTLWDRIRTRLGDAWRRVRWVLRDAWEATRGGVWTDL